MSALTGNVSTVAEDIVRLYELGMLVEISSDKREIKGLTGTQKVIEKIVDFNDILYKVTCEEVVFRYEDAVRKFYKIEKC